MVSPVARTPHANPEIHFHRSRAIPGRDILVVDGDRTTCFTRTICDLAYVLTKFQLANVLHEGAFQKLLDRRDLAWRLEQDRGRPWTLVVRAALALHDSGSAGTRSLSEDRFVDEWCLRGFPEPRVNDSSATGLLGIECDFVWPELHLVVEIDGEPGHGRPNATHKDFGRDATLRADGWKVVRIPSDDVWADLDRCIRMVRSNWFVA